MTTLHAPPGVPCSSRGSSSSVCSPPGVPTAPQTARPPSRTSPRASSARRTSRASRSPATTRTTGSPSSPSGRRVYLDAAELCLGALLRGDVVGRRGACVDVHQAYVADARSGPRDLDGRLGAVQAGRAFGLAYSAVVAERSRRTAESMTAGTPPPPDR